MDSENTILERLAVIETTLKNEVIDELKEMRKENKENAKHYLELTTKTKDLEKDIQMLKLEVQHLKEKHELDIAQQNKKWDVPTKVFVSILSAIALAVLSLVLK